MVLTVKFLFTDILCTHNTNSTVNTKVVATLQEITDQQRPLLNAVIMS